MQKSPWLHSKCSLTTKSVCLARSIYVKFYFANLLTKHSFKPCHCTYRACPTSETLSGQGSENSLYIFVNKSCLKNAKISLTVLRLLIN